MSGIPNFRAFLAKTADEVSAAQKLRHQVFVDELGARPTEENREIDCFDRFADHLLLVDETAQGERTLAAVYRLMNKEQASRADGFSSEKEFDLGPLIKSGRNILELGRSCVHPDYRDGLALLHIWKALAGLIEERQAEILFGAASFHGSNAKEHEQALSLLHHKYRAPKCIRPVSRVSSSLALKPSTEVDGVRVMSEVPSLIKSYLRIGGCIGDGFFEDKEFNTTDVCMVLDVTRMNHRHRTRYAMSTA